MVNCSGPWPLGLVLLLSSCSARDPLDAETTMGSGTTVAAGSSTTTDSNPPGDSASESDPAVGTSTGSASSGSDANTTGPEGPIFDVGTVPDMPGDQPAPPTDIDVVITADNAYAFGYGDAAMMASYFGGVAAITAGQIFNCMEGPESYVVPAEDTAEYLYIVAYADPAVTQGVLGQFRRVSDAPDGTPGEVVYTGDPGWEACATGVDFDPSGPAPTLDVINAQIELCNAGNTDPDSTSAGWVDEIGTPYGALAVGETNDSPYAGGPIPGNEFPIVCDTEVDAEARWMWFNWDPDVLVWPVQSPFLYPGGPGNPMHDFMIFRLATAVLPQPPAG
jgi:hypothetical protein